MKVTWRLVLNALAWAAAIPAFNLLLMALSHHRIMEASGPVAAFAASALLVWAGLIYWYCVPNTRNLLQRMGYLVAFVAGMAALGMGALWVAFWTAVATYGL